MSMAALRWARGIRGISSTQKLVLWALADSANDYGEAWPSALLLAEDCCLKDRAVRYALDELEALGLIVGQRRIGHAARWIVQIGAAPALDAARPAPDAEGSASNAGVDEGTAPRQNPGTKCRSGSASGAGVGRHVVPGGSASGADITLMNPHGTLIEPPKGAKRRAVVLPHWLPPPAWADWVKYRRSQKGWTDKAAELSIRELAKLHAAGHQPQAVIEQSIANGWRGLFPIKGSSGRYQPREALHDTVADIMRDPMGFAPAPPTAFDFEGEADHG